MNYIPSTQNFISISGSSASSCSFKTIDYEESTELFYSDSSWACLIPFELYGKVTTLELGSLTYEFIKISNQKVISDESSDKYLKFGMKNSVLDDTFTCLRLVRNQIKETEGIVEDTHTIKCLKDERDQIIEIHSRVYGFLAREIIGKGKEAEKAEEMLQFDDEATIVAGQLFKSRANTLVLVQFSTALSL